MRKGYLYSQLNYSLKVSKFVFRLILIFLLRSGAAIHVPAHSLQFFSLDWQVASASHVFLFREQHESKLKDMFFRKFLSQAIINYLLERSANVSIL